MNRKPIYILLAIFLFLSDLSANRDKLTFPGHSGAAYFSDQGNLQVLYTDSRGGIRHSLHGDILLGSDTVVRSLRRDARGRLWVLWQEGRREHQALFLGRLTEGFLRSRVNLCAGMDGIAYSPEMIIAADDSPWVVWVNVAKGHHALMVRNGRTHHTWSPAATVSASLHSPRILSDRDGRIWIFWTAPVYGYDDIFFTVYENEIWSPPQCLTADPEKPHLHPSAALNSAGFPVVAWSAYDGEDYEIYMASWSGSAWGIPEKITSNHYISDVQPSLALYLETIPVIAWTRAGPEKTEIYLSHKQGDTWQPAVRLSRSPFRSTAPCLITDGGRLAAVWNTPSHIHAMRLDWPFGIPASPPETIPGVRALASPLEPEKFSAFGDSITYGSMDGPEMGRGYVPRLQELLPGLFTFPMVVNRGIPGEATWEGLSRIHQVIANDLPSYLLLMEGTNDVTDAGQSMAATDFNLREMLQTCRDFGIFPMISTIIPRARDRWDAFSQARTEDLNLRIDQLAQDLRVMLVDNSAEFFAYPLDSGGYEALYSSDNLHPNDLGYQIMAETWFAKIKRIPFPPINLQAVRKDRNKVIQLTWADDPRTGGKTKISKYRIFRQTVGKTDFFAIAIVPAAIKRFEDKTFRIEEQYRYAVAVITSDEIQGFRSEPVDTIRGEPYAPVDTIVETVVNKALLYWEYINLVSWTENPLNAGQFTVVKYRVYRKPEGTADTSYQLIREVPVSQREIMDRGFSSQAAAAAYDYGITAVDADDEESPFAQSLSSRPSPIRASRIRQMKK